VIILLWHLFAKNAKSTRADITFEAYIAREFDNQATEDEVRGVRVELPQLQAAI
jgi:hypothetical protein